jgi:hypothetical protein
MSWVRFDRRQHHVAQVGLPGVLASARGGLQYDRASRLFGSLHDGLDLLEIVDVECGHAIAVLSGMIQQLAQGYKGHRVLLTLGELSE